MLAFGYLRSHSLQDFSIQKFECSLPEVRNTDVLVRVHSISINPIDQKIRMSRNASSEHPVVLGWDASGVIEKVGSACKGFQVGDEVFYAGDLLRDGSYAELQAVDYRIIARKPKSLSFSQAAALPLTSLTAWEALLERNFQFTSHSKVLIIGGAGGVGSMAIQLLKARTPARVIATASRPESVEWAKRMGADAVIDHSGILKDELTKIDVKEVDIVFATTHSNAYQTTAPEILRPFGHFCLIEDAGTLQTAGFSKKAISVHWELMFSKTLHSYNLESQGKILTEVAALANAGKIQSTANLYLQGLSTKTLLEAHTRQESGRSVGKTVITVLPEGSA